MSTTASKRDSARSSRPYRSEAVLNQPTWQKAGFDSRDLHRSPSRIAAMGFGIREEYARYQLDELQRQGDNRRPTPSPLGS
jgi:hypothetical protein